VEQRFESKTNPNVNRVQLIGVIGTLAYGEAPVVLAESSTEGVNGCFREFLTSIKDCSQVEYFDDMFNDFLEEEYGFRITYRDGLIYMLEKFPKEE
jgi:hypothetical protein